MKKKHIPMPAELSDYKGYDWADFIQFKDNKSEEELIEEFKDYVKRSILDMSQEEIIEDLKSAIKNNEIKRNSVKEVIKFIINNPQYHKYLVMIGDGSYRTNRILYAGYYETFMYHINSKAHNLEEVFDSIVKEDGSIFIQRYKKWIIATPYLNDFR